MTIEKVGKHTVELRAGLSGFSLELNGHQVGYYDQRQEDFATDYFMRLVHALRIKEA